MIKIYRGGQFCDGKVFDRSEEKNDVTDIVSDIIGDVRRNGDEALRRYAEKFDGVKLDALEVTSEEIDEAFAAVDDKFISVLKKAAVNIEAFHKNQLRSGFEVHGENGSVLGQRVLPLARAGLYVPGGTAAYPSSVLMNCIPAKIAGVGQIIMITPPSRDGKINPVILAAAKIAGVHRIFKSGGAQAIAALAYGTESIPQVDKIVGPGNAFVAEAKRQVFGQVAIDMIAGPSEILILADETGEPKHIAADMLSQAEHDKRASAVLLTASYGLALAVQEELERQIPLLPRQDIARVSIDNNGKIIVVADFKEAVDIANSIAPEHLEICVDEPFLWLDKIRNAGSVFLGKNCPEALGDYFAGPNHVLPTGGTARFSSPLSVDDFLKRSAYTYYTKDALAEVYEDIAYFAESEGLSAHARSVLTRFEG